MPDLPPDQIAAARARADAATPECYWNKYHPTEPQCKNTVVGHRPPIGNLTDAWAWCGEHIKSPLREIGGE